MYHFRHQGVKRGMALLILLALLAVFPLSSSLILAQDREAEAPPLPGPAQIGPAQTVDVTVEDSTGDATLVGVIGQVVVLNIEVENIVGVTPGLGTYDVRLEYDPAVLNALAVQDGDTPFGAPLASNIKNTTGVVTASGSQTATIPGPTTDTVVVRVQVQVVGFGNSALDLVLNLASVVDTNGDNVTSTGIDGTFLVTGFTLTPDEGLATTITGAGFDATTALTIVFGTIDLTAAGAVVGDTATDGTGAFVSIITAPDQTAGAFTVTVDDGTNTFADTFTVPDLQGPKGLKGKEGDEGDEGETGPAGPPGPGGPGGAGPPGPPGPPGVAGPAGPAGSAGPAGPAGTDGATGPTGSRGSSGSAGADGATGADGASGATGATGSAGPKGDDGGGGLGIVGLVLGVVGTAGAALALSYTFGMLRRPGV